MNWIDGLKELAPVVAIVVVFYFTLRVIAKYFVEPLRLGISEAVDSLQLLVSNHFAHDAQDRQLDREARQKQVEAFDRLVQCIQEMQDKQ